MLQHWKFMVGRSFWGRTTLIVRAGSCVYMAANFFQHGMRQSSQTPLPRFTSTGQIWKTVGSLVLPRQHGEQTRLLSTQMGVFSRLALSLYRITHRISVMYIALRVVV